MKLVCSWPWLLEACDSRAVLGLALCPSPYRFVVCRVTCCVQDKTNDKSLKLAVAIKCSPVWGNASALLFFFQFFFLIVQKHQQQKLCFMW